MLPAATSGSRRAVIHLRSGEEYQLTPEGWSGPNADMATVLDHVGSLAVIDARAHGYDPDPLRTAAVAGAKHLKAKLTWITPQAARPEGAAE
jgi:hypothetical protein